MPTRISTPESTIRAIHVPADSAGDLVAMALRATEMHEDAARDSRKPVAPAILSPVFLNNPNRVFNGVTMALRAAKADEDAVPVVGQAPRPAAEPQLGAGALCPAGSAGDLVARVRTNRVFNGVTMALRAAKVNEDAARPLWGRPPGPMPLSFVGRDPRPAADALVGPSGFVELTRDGRGRPSRIRGSAPPNPAAPEKLSGIGPPGLPPSPSSARNFTSAGSAGDLVARVRTNRVFNGVAMALRAAKVNEDAAPVVGQAPRPAAEPQLGAGALRPAGSAGDLVAGVRTDRVFNGAATSRSRGSALLMVLWLTAALSAIGLAVANNVRGETERTATNVDDVRAYFIARGAIQQAALHFMWGSFFRSSEGQPIYHIPGDPSMNLSYPSAEVHVDIIPETSKLSLNGSRPEYILGLLAALGVPEGPANEITAAIVDWRTPVPPTETSPFDAYYLSLSPSFLPRHASFLENEELLLVRGMTSDLYYGTSLDKSHPGLRDCVSVYGSAGAVDINTAQLPVLEAVGLAPEDAAAIVRNRAGHPILAGAELAAMAQSLGPGGSRLMIGGQTIYTLRATARMKGPDGKLSDLRRTVAALVKFNFTAAGSMAIGFDVLRWFDRA